MQEFVKVFFSSLHREYLKPRGYKKVRFTFSRDMNGYIERIQFQGSSWNASTGPWRFYINFGIEFPDIPFDVPNLGFPGTHCRARIEHIATTSPSEFDLPANCDAELAQKIVEYVDVASSRVAEQINFVRQNIRTKKELFVAAIRIEFTLNCVVCESERLTAISGRRYSLRSNWRLLRSHGECTFSNTKRLT